MNRTLDESDGKRRAEYVTNLDFAISTLGNGQVC